MPFYKASRGTAQLFFVNPLRCWMNERDGKLADLLASHPPIERRIALLYRMAGIAQPAIASSQVQNANLQGIR